jgi:hypothetical protein
VTRLPEPQLEAAKAYLARTTTSAANSLIAIDLLTLSGVLPNVSVIRFSQYSPRPCQYGGYRTDTDSKFKKQKKK